MNLTLGDEHVIFRGPRPEDAGWGPCQFPAPFRTQTGVMVAIHLGEDSPLTYGSDKLWLESRDDGDTWQITTPDAAKDCGLRLPNGDILRFPRTNGISLEGYDIPTPEYMTPGVEFTRPADEGTLPMQDGITFWQWGIVIRAYLADRLPPSLRAKEWYLLRTVNGIVREEHPKLDWPYLTRVVFTDAQWKNPSMKGIFPTGVPKIGPDGAIWVTAFSGEGHIDPASKQYSPYYSAELFRSEDNGHTFRLHAHMEYPADGKKYPYLSGGFSDNDIAFFDDGSICWFFRSAWACSTGREWAPMYLSRSRDGGRTWSPPEEFAFTGVYPSLCRLDCGVTLLCYARPGMFLTACPNDDSTGWIAPITLMTPGDRSALANARVDTPKFHDWDGADHNAVVIALNDNTALLFYVDFYYLDKDGVKRKTVLCRKITVTP